MNRTKIEWVKNPDGSQGYTWNPITGCLNGCEYCYARKLANTRLKERYLAKIEAKVKYISFEPLLSGLGKHIPGWLQACMIDAGINWVIIGAQTKPTVYPKIEWVKEIVEACDKAGIPVFLKDNLYKLLFERPVQDHDLYWACMSELRQEMPK